MFRSGSPSAEATNNPYQDRLFISTEFEILLKN